MWTESRGRLPTHLLVGDQVQTYFMHAKFFFFLNEYKICLPGGQRILVHVFRGPKVLDPGSYFQRPRIFGSWLMFSEDQGFLGLWLMFSEDQRFWILAHVFKGLGFWILAHVFRGPRVLGLWLMFSEDQRFWILAQDRKSVV